MDNKAGENYFGHMSQQLRSKGGSAFNAISDRQVLKFSSDLAFGKDAAYMLRDKELKSKRQKIDQIEANWSRAQQSLKRYMASGSHCPIGSHKLLVVVMGQRPR